MSAVFDQPIRVSVSKPYADTPPGLLLGIVGAKGELGLIMLPGGSLKQVPFDHFTVDWRYDVEKDMWIDENVRASEEEV